LNSDGILFETRHSQRLSSKDASQARRIVAFCPLPANYSTLARVDALNDVPLASVNYGLARYAILTHLQELIARAEI
jgi:hypothetical protein